MVTEFLCWVRRVLRLHPLARIRATASTWDDDDLPPVKLQPRPARPARVRARDYQREQGKKT